MSKLLLWAVVLVPPLLGIGVVLRNSRTRSPLGSVPRGVEGIVPEGFDYAAQLEELIRESDRLEAELVSRRVWEEQDPGEAAHAAPTPEDPEARARDPLHGADPYLLHYWFGGETL